MATAIATSGSSPPTYDVVKARVHRILSTHANTPSPTTDNKNNNTYESSLTLTELCREYVHIYNKEQIPYQELGYETLTRFLSSMRDIVRMDLNEWPARCYLRKISKPAKRQSAVISTGSLTNLPLTKNQNEAQHEGRFAVTYAGVKNEIMSLLQRSAEANDGQPLTFTELCSQYEAKHNGHRLPYERLGYPTLQSLLDTMWDSVRVDNRRCYLVTSTENKAGTKKGRNKNKHREDRMT